jgi:hypothetical protein
MHGVPCLPNFAGDGVTIGIAIDRASGASAFQIRIVEHGQVMRLVPWLGAT